MAAVSFGEACAGPAITPISRTQPLPCCSALHENSFRVVAGFMAQFGIHGRPSVMEAWRPARIKDDAVKQSNLRGYVTFATSGPNTRTTQLFVNFRDNAGLDKQGFAPVGQITAGMDIVDQLYDGYGEGAPRGKGPDQGAMQTEGNAYLAKGFPKLDFIKTTTIVP